mgnify:CR=1 FL=1
MGGIKIEVVLGLGIALALIAIAAMVLMVFAPYGYAQYFSSIVNIIAILIFVAILFGLYLRYGRR